LEQKPFQDIWPEPATHCFGCGRNNNHGLQIKSYWEGDEAVCIWQPKEHHMAALGVLCGGIIATVIDCHCLNAAMAAVMRAEGLEIGEEQPYMVTTGSLSVQYLKPTPTDIPIELRAKVEEISEKKIVISCSLFSKRKECARGQIVAIKVPNDFWQK
jgi:acyl-coenzyme A thioesterase PaaI-like protein